MIQHLLIELMQGLAWSSFGFLGGWLGCSYKRRLDRISEEVVVIAEGDAEKNVARGTEGAKGAPGKKGASGGPGAEGSRGGPGGVGGTGGEGGEGGGTGGTGGSGGVGGAGDHGEDGGEHGLPRWVGMVLILFALFAVGEGYYFNQQDKQQVECQSQYNEDFAKSLILRNQWAAEDRAANLQMWEDVLREEDPAVRRQSVVDYVETIKKNNIQRAKAPLPNLDQRNCEER